MTHQFKARGFAGATVLRGVSGFGSSSRVHTENVLWLSLDLPMIVEVVETEERIKEIFPSLDAMFRGGLITLERAQVIMYRPTEVRESEVELHRIDGVDESDSNRQPS